MAPSDSEERSAHTMGSNHEEAAAQTSNSDVEALAEQNSTSSNTNDDEATAQTPPPDAQEHRLTMFESLMLSGWPVLPEYPLAHDISTLTLDGHGIDTQDYPPTSCVECAAIRESTVPRYSLPGGPGSLVPPPQHPPCCEFHCLYFQSCTSCQVHHEIYRQVQRLRQLRY